MGFFYIYGQNLLSVIKVTCEQSLKVGSFSEPPKYLSFSSLTQSYLLKVTKLLLEISQFEFLAMTEKIFFAYKLFLSLSISDLNLFFMWKLQPSPLKKVTLLFPSNTPLKVEVLPSPLFGNLGGGSTPSAQAEGGKVQTMLCRQCQWSCYSKFWSVFLVVK